MATGHLTESKVCLSKGGRPPLEFGNALLYFEDAQEKEIDLSKTRIGANELRH